MSSVALPNLSPFRSDQLRIYKRTLQPMMVHSSRSFPCPSAVHCRHAFYASSTASSVLLHNRTWRHYPTYVAYRPHSVSSQSLRWSSSRKHMATATPPVSSLGMMYISDSTGTNAGLLTVFGVPKPSPNDQSYAGTFVHELSMMSASGLHCAVKLVLRTCSGDCDRYVNSDRVRCATSDVLMSTRRRMSAAMYPRGVLKRSPRRKCVYAMFWRMPG